MCLIFYSQRTLVCVWSMWFYFLFRKTFSMDIFHHRNSKKISKGHTKNRQTKRKGTRIKSNYLQPSKTKEKGIESFERFAKEQKTIAINKNCEHFSRNAVSIQSNREKYSIFSSLSVCHCEYALVSSCGLFFSL